jgi:CPA2 family monovalent cation:H+ antiporter-2
VLPFRDVFNSIFFVSIGMLLSLGALAANLPVVLGWVGALVVGKALVVLAVVRMLGYSLRVATVTGLGLAQIGEFSFILAKGGLAQGLLSPGDYQTGLAASILSMIATPFLIVVAPRVGYAVQSRLSPDSLLEPSMMGFARAGEDLRGHVIVVGYGLNGTNLSRVLRSVKIPYRVLELNAETVREASARGEPILYGDSTRKEVLRSARLEHARVLVLAISDPIASRRTVQLARQMNPDIHIIVRTRYMSELEDLYGLGADQVIPEEFETSVEIFARVLQEYGIARGTIERHVEAIRREGYQMLRSPLLPIVEMSDIAEALSAASTQTVRIGAGALAAGRTVGELDLRKRTGATVIAVSRGGVTDVNPGPEFRLEVGDVVVLLGSDEQIGLAIDHIAAPS